MNTPPPKPDAHTTTLTAASITTPEQSYKRTYIPPCLFVLEESSIEGGNTPNNAEATGGLWTTAAS